MKNVKLSDDTRISRLMHSQLKDVKKILKKNKHMLSKIKPGMIRPLHDEEFKDGSKIQVDLVCDFRLFDYPYIAVYYFKPSKNMGARTADYVLNNKDEVFAEHNTGKHVAITIRGKKFVGIYKHFDKDAFKEGGHPHEIVVPSSSPFKLTINSIMCSLKELSLFKGTL